MMDECELFGCDDLDEADQFLQGGFPDIMEKDSRYDPLAYAFLLKVIHEASEEMKGHMTGQELLLFYRNFMLDNFGPMAYCVLTSWGVKTCEDVGAMVFNLYDSKRIQKTKEDCFEDFIGGYDFNEAFRKPFEVDWDNFA